MEQIIELLSKYGVSLVIVGLFLYDWLTTRKEMSNALKQNSTCLEEIKNTNKNNAQTNRNTAKSLELLQSSMDTQKEFLFQHDKRCEDAVYKVVDAINTYEMTDEQVEALPTTSVVEQTEEQENAVEQTVENEGFELQGEIAYEGAKDQILECRIMRLQRTNILFSIRLKMGK